MMKYKKLPLLVITSIFIITLSIVSVTLAKYVFNDQRNTVIVSDEFIFVSNYVDGNTYGIDRDNIDIIVSNNMLSLVNEEDIKFNISIKNKETSVILNSYENQVLSGEAMSSLSFNFNGLVVNNTYIVTISSVSPVKKTITHEFNVIEDVYVDSFYTLIDMGAWIELDIYVGTNSIINLNIIYSVALAADNTNELTNNWYETSGTLINLKQNAHYHLIFFKNDDAVYDNINNGEIIDNKITIS